MGRLSRLNPFARDSAVTVAAEARDVVGRVLEPGDEVLVIDHAFFFRVQSIQPVLDPKLAPNTVLVQLTGLVTATLRSGGALKNVVLTRRPVADGPPPDGNHRQDTGAG